MQHARTENGVSLRPSVQTAQAYHRSGGGRRRARSGAQGCVRQRSASTSAINHRLPARPHLHHWRLSENQQKQTHRDQCPVTAAQSTSSAAWDKSWIAHKDRYKAPFNKCALHTLHLSVTQLKVGLVAQYIRQIGDVQHFKNLSLYLNQPKRRHLQKMPIDNLQPGIELY